MDPLRHNPFTTPRDIFSLYTYIWYISYITFIYRTFLRQKYVIYAPENEILYIFPILQNFGIEIEFNFIMILLVNDCNKITMNNLKAIAIHPVSIFYRLILVFFSNSSYFMFLSNI